jgi:hypothetical protein
MVWYGAVDSETWFYMIDGEAVRVPVRVVDIIRVPRRHHFSHAHKLAHIHIASHIHI